MTRMSREQKNARAQQRRQDRKDEAEKREIERKATEARQEALWLRVPSARGKVFAVDWTEAEIQQLMATRPKNGGAK